ncbi:MAG: hypothetical protein U1E65_30760 [Myxococcota bacterium]
MEEIKRGRVPFQRPSMPQTRPAGVDNLKELDQTGEAQEIAKKKRPVLGTPEAGLKGNALTGLTLDARPDLPPFLYNPKPKEMMARRKSRLAKTYAPPRELRHPTAGAELKRLMDPKTSAVAKLQRLVNTNPVVRAAFERKVVAKVVPDGRSDGTISVLPPTGGNTAVATGAMSMGGQTSGSSSSPSRDFYEMLAKLERDVMNQVQKTAATATSSTGAWSSASVGPSMPIGSAMESSLSEAPTGISSDDSDDEDGGSWSSPTADSTSTAASGMTAIAPGAPALPSNTNSSNAGNASTDIEAQKVQMLIQRLNQMYSLISGMFSKYNQAATASINSLK